MNSVNIVGNVTRDPEVRELSSGNKVCSFGIASNRTYVQDGEKKEDTIYLDVDTWGRLAETCGKFLRKGKKAAITGRLRQEVWESDGQKRYKISCTANEVEFLSPVEKEDSESSVGPAF